MFQEGKSIQAIQYLEVDKCKEKSTPENKTKMFMC
jgi:hypothetical protein